MAMDFTDLEPIFGEAKPDFQLSNPNNANPLSLNPFLFRVFATDSSHLKFNVTDFGSDTWEATRSIHQLDDMRDGIGIGGSWSDFMNYVLSSFKSSDVKVVLAWESEKNGSTSAKLVARKSKGMPLISITLSKLGGSAASEVMRNLSLELFKAYSVLRDSFRKEQERCGQLLQVISADKDNQAIKWRVDAAMLSGNQGLHRAPDMGNGASMNPGMSSMTATLDSLEKQSTGEAQPTKVAPHVVPAFRRAKVRGAVLNNNAEEEVG